MKSNNAWYCRRMLLMSLLLEYPNSHTLDWILYLIFIHSLMFTLNAITTLCTIDVSIQHTLSHPPNTAHLLKSFRYNTPSHTFSHLLTPSQTFSLDIGGRTQGGVAQVDPKERYTYPLMYLFTYQNTPSPQTHTPCNTPFKHSILTPFLTRHRIASPCFMSHHITFHLTILSLVSSHHITLFYFSSLLNRVFRPVWI